jgi:ATP-dependent helicase HrpB
VLPLHGELPPRDQDAAVAHHDRRKIVVATNVAETSVTIDGIRIVIDSGLVRRPHFDPHRGINTLWIEKVSRASADQRAGRAGRTAPGLCVRLWTEQEHGGRALHDLPEIKRLDLSEILLTLKAAGIDEDSGFVWLEPPDPAARERAMTLLRDLGAVAGPRDLVTGLGRRMAAFPLHPRYARMLLAAEPYRAVRPVALIAALTQGRSLFTHRQDRAALEQREELLGASAASDFLVWMRAWHYAARQRFSVEACRRLGIHAQAARQVQPVFDSFLRIAAQQGLTVEDRPAADEDLCRCVLAGFADQVAVRRDEGTRVCRVVHGRTGRLAPDSAVRDARLVVASDINEIQRGRDGEGEVMLQLATRIEEEWLTELFPDAVRTVDAAWYDPASKRVLCEERRLYHDLVLRSKRGGTPPQEEAARLLADQILQGHLTLNQWDQAVEQWIARVNNLSAWCPDLGLPSIGPEEKRLLFEQLCLGAYSYKDIRNKPVRPLLHALLSPPQRALVERHAPERLQLGGARAFRLHYTPDAPPALSARIQELFGVTRLPRIAQGKVQPVLHILAPNQRPVQITQDLPGFWREHYPGIRQTLKRKYPKHAWPEDPGPSM